VVHPADRAGHSIASSRAMNGRNNGLSGPRRFSQFAM
jgi:hypothetical protein